MTKLLENSRIVKGRKAQNLIDNYDYVMSRYGCRDLDDCYNSCSYYKYSAYENICNECYKYGGHGLTISTYNTQRFTCAYLVEIDGKTWLIYHTHDYRYAVEY